MKIGKNESGKYYYLSLTNHRKYSSWCSVFGSMREVKVTGSKVTGRSGSKHNIQIEK